MKIIPFRIKATEKEDDFSDIYEFLIKGTNKDAYVIEIFIDDANDLGIVLEQCTCPHFKFRGEICKHIEKAKEILTEFEILTPCINSANIHQEIGEQTPSCSRASGGATVRLGDSAVYDKFPGDSCFVQIASEEVKNGRD